MKVAYTSNGNRPIVALTMSPEEREFFKDTDYHVVLKRDPRADDIAHICFWLQGDPNGLKISTQSPGAVTNGCYVSFGVLALRLNMGRLPFWGSTVASMSQMENGEYRLLIKRADLTSVRVRGSAAKKAPPIKTVAKKKEAAPAAERSKPTTRFRMSPTAVQIVELSPVFAGKHLVIRELEPGSNKYIVYTKED